MLSCNICSEHTDNSLDKDNMCNTKNKYIHSKDKKIRDVSGKKYKNEISIITYSFVLSFPMTFKYLHLQHAATKMQTPLKLESKNNSKDKSTKITKKERKKILYLSKIQLHSYL